MRSVMVTKFLPLPADSGGKQRSLAVLTRLASLGEVILCAFEEGNADLAGLAKMGVDVRSVPWRPTVPRIARGVLHAWSGSAARFWDADLAELVRTATAEAPTDVLQVEYATLAPYLTGAKATLRVLDLHNIESALAASYARGQSGLKSLPVWLETAALRGVERRGLRKVDVATVVSENDRMRLPRSRTEILLCPNGWNPTGPLPPATGPVVIFVALLKWRPNSDAAVWLVNEVWPLVRARQPEAHLLLVGRSPGPRVQRLAAEDITVTGTVPDVRPYLSRARVAVAPLLSGGGTRLKVLEALDVGRPVVASPIGAEGLDDLVGRGVTVTSTAAAMAEVIADLLADPERATKAGLQGSQAVAERYAWDVVLAPWMARVRSAGSTG
ncbi:MAG: glycosyltransferase family 4 protein [Pseudonocardiales bacterium]